MSVEIICDNSIIISFDLFELSFMKVSSFEVLFIQEFKLKIVEQKKNNQGQYDEDKFCWKYCVEDVEILINNKSE